MDQTQPITLTEENFNHQVLESPYPSVVHFCACWSGSSDIMTSIIDDLALGYSGEITFCCVDVDEHSKIAARYGIITVPTLIFLDKGRVVDQIRGMISKGELGDKLGDLVA